MATDMKRLTVSFLPEWEEQLKFLKKETFYDKPKSEMIRFLIQKGLEATTNLNTKNDSTQ